MYQVESEAGIAAALVSIHFMILTEISATTIRGVETVSVLDEGVKSQVNTKDLSGSLSINFFFFSCSSLPFHNIEASTSLFLNRSRVEKGEQISRLVGWFKGGKMLVVDGSRWQKIYTKINTALSTVKASFDE